jgi:hypothetical protein
MLSDRVRPDVEAAPWVIKEIQRLEEELDSVYLELYKQKSEIAAIFDPIVWENLKRRFE